MDDVGDVQTVINPIRFALLTVDRIEIYHPRHGRMPVLPSLPGKIGIRAR